MAGNEALDINPPIGESVLSVNGSNWLWAVCALFGLAFLIVFGWSFKAKAGEKVFHYIYTIALLVSTIAYFAMASDLGYSVVDQANEIAKGASRQIFFAKYINWVVSFPALLLAIGLASGVSWAVIIFNIFLAWTWIVSFLVAAYTTTNYKWGFFVAGVVTWNLIGCNLFQAGRTAARRVGIARDYTIMAGWLNSMFLVYTVAFGISDGGNNIGVTPSFIFFGILDILTFIGIAFTNLGLATNWDFNKMNLAFTQYGRVPQGAFLPDKGPAPAPVAAGAQVV
jgi:bacteriorhodopsin